MNLKTLIIVAILLFLLWMGYVAYAVTTAEPQVEARWGKVNEKTSEIVINANLRHPLMVPVSVKELSINFTGVKVAWIEGFKYGSTKNNLTLSLLLDNHNLVRALVNYLNNGEKGNVEIILRGNVLWIIPINSEIKENISEKILEKLNFTAESKEYLNGLFKTPSLLGTKVEWLGEKRGKALLIVHMKFYNPNSYPLPVANASFDLYANGVKVGYGSTERALIMPAKGYATLNVTLTIDEGTLPKVWAIHVERGEKSTVKADIFLNLRLFGREYTVKIASYEEKVQTSIMDSINAALNDMLG